jgi:hypothetical protein
MKSVAESVDLKRDRRDYYYVASILRSKEAGPTVRLLRCARNDLPHGHCEEQRDEAIFTCQNYCGRPLVD